MVHRKGLGQCPKIEVSGKKETDFIMKIVEVVDLVNAEGADNNNFTGDLELSIVLIEEISEADERIYCV